MPAITPVGYAAEKPSFHEQLMRSTMKSARRKPWKELFFRADFKTPLTEADAGAYAEPLELLRLAPSATNAQPWRVVMDGQFFHFYAVVGKEALAANPPRDPAGGRGHRRLPLPPGGAGEGPARAL